MALYDTANLVLRVQAALNRPSTDEMFTISVANDAIYMALTDQQHDEIQYIAARCPEAMYLNPVQMSTSDSGATFNFGDDADSADIIALGHFQIFASTSDIPDCPLEEGTDYLVEDDNIRILPYGQTRSPSPYARFVKPGNVIASGTEPTLPKECRPALVSGACARLASDRLKQDPTPFIYRLENDRQNYMLALRTRSAQAGGSVSNGRRRVIRWSGMGN
jgi:hypothetical protein